MPFEIWNEQYLKGATVDDLIQTGLEHTSYFTEKDFDNSDLTFYKTPDIDEMKDKKIIFRWMSYYKKWTPQENYYYAVKNTGFTNDDGRTEGTYSKYASLDDLFDGFHYYLAFIKFEAEQLLILLMKFEMDITRDEAIRLVKKFDGEFPSRYFTEFLEYLDIDKTEFWRVIDKFRSNHIWTKKKKNMEIKKTIYDDILDKDETPTYIASVPND